jgi:hypothetical protein
MDSIEFVVLLSVIIVVLNLFFVFWYLIYEDCIKRPAVGKKPIFLPEALADFIRSNYSQFLSITRPIFIAIVVFYIIFYVFYLIIIFIIPETGIATLFIPVRELLLKIPPFPQLIKYGVIKLMDDIVMVSGLKGHLLRFFTFNKALFVFSKDNIKRIFNHIFPKLGDKIVEAMNVKEEEENNDNKRIEPELDPKNKVYKKIETETDICASNKLINITPDMTEGEMQNARFKNTMITANCHSKSVGKYIRSNN